MRNTKAYLVNTRLGCNHLKLQYNAENAIPELINYSLRNDATNTNTPVTLTAGSAQYTKAPSAAETARAALVAAGWTITDGGPTP